jgi:hypothetical protein
MVGGMATYPTTDLDPPTIFPIPIGAHQGLAHPLAHASVQIDWPG